MIRPRPGHLSGLGLLLLALSLAATTGCGLLEDPGSSLRLEAIEDFRAEDLDGTIWDRERMQGKVVLLDFWATWCGPCIRELPYLRMAYERHHADGFEILGISLDGPDRRALRDWLEKQDVRWPQIHDGAEFDSQYARDFGVSAIPRSILIGRDGEVIATNLRGQQLVRAVEAAVGR